MKILKQLGIIMFIYFLSHILQIALKIPLPATIIGMILLLVFLITGIIKLEMIEDLSQFFLDNLTFLFVPAGVGLILSLDLISQNALAIIVITIVSVVIIISVTALFIQVLNKLLSKKESRND